MTQILMATMIGISALVAPANSVDGGLIATIITNETWMTPTPTYSSGRAVFYGPYAMDATAKYRGIDYEEEGCMGGVALMSPYNIGDKAWVRIDGEWYGPFCVVDCAKRNEMYSIVVDRKEVIEINFELAVKVGIVSEHINGAYEVYNWYKDVEVLVNISPEIYFRWNKTNEPIVYRDYFLETLELATVEPRWLITIEEGRVWKEYDIDKYWIKYEIYPNVMISFKPEFVIE